MTLRPPLPVVGVVVPAHDEAELLPVCLDALAAATRAVAGLAVVRTVVVLDACTDGSAVAAHEAGVETVVLDARRVGAARRRGVAALGDTDWLATTDADSTVPPGWLVAQLAALAEGADALVGTVEVADWSGHPPAVRAWFDEVYDSSGDPHPHVHGANLGVRTAAYVAVGGFAPLRTGEDVALVRALVAAGHRVHRSRTHPVVTSSRTGARAPDGFGRDLLRLGR